MIGLPTLLNSGVRNRQARTRKPPCRNLQTGGWQLAVGSWQVPPSLGIHWSTLDSPFTAACMRTRRTLFSHSDNKLHDWVTNLPVKESPGSWQWPGRREWERTGP